MTDRPVESREEIELIEILRVMWKWKYLILAGTLVFALVAGVISSNRPKVYRINMVLKPGVVRIDRLGRRIYLDSVTNMKTLLEAGTLNNEIRTYLEALKAKNKLGPVQFRIAVPKKSNLLRISYETQYVDTGVQILNHIPDLLQKEYSAEINHFEKEYNDKIQKEIEELADIGNEKKIIQSKIIIFEKRLKELILAIDNIKNDNRRLVEEKGSYNKNSNEASVNIDLLYSSAIQQNLQLMNKYKSQLVQFLSEKDKIKIELQRIEERIRFASTEIADLKKEKSNIKYIKVLRPPTSSASPVKPMIKFNVMLAAVVGFFLTVFLAFLMEYLSKQKRLE